MPEVGRAEWWVVGNGKDPSYPSGIALKLIFSGPNPVILSRENVKVDQVFKCTVAKQA